MTRAEWFQRTLQKPGVEAKRRKNQAAANATKLLRYCPKRGYAVPPELLADYRHMLKRKGIPARECAQILGLIP